MTKAELIKQLEFLPSGAEVVIRHPAIQGCVIPVESVGVGQAGECGAYNALHLVKYYPDSENRRTIILLDWAPIDVPL